MNNLKIVIRLENVMINGFDVENNYEKDLKRRLQLEKKMNEGVEYIKVKMDEIIKEKVMLNDEIGVLKGVIKVEKDKENIKRLKGYKLIKEEKKKELIKELRKLRSERDEEMKEIRNELVGELEEIINKDLVIKRMKKEYDDRFEDLKLKKGVKEIFDRLVRLNLYYKDVDIKIVVMSDVRSLKVKRLLNNVGLDFCEVVNSSIDGWRENLVEEKYEIMLVESKEELVGLIDKVKLFLLDKKG